MMTAADVAVFVLSYDRQALAVERHDGGWTIIKGRSAAGVAPEVKPFAPCGGEATFRAYLSDAVLAVQMFEVERRRREGGDALDPVLYFMR